MIIARPGRRRGALPPAGATARALALPCLLALVTSACSGPSTPAATGSPTTTAPPSGRTTVTATVTATVTSPATSSAPTRCEASQVSVSAGQVEAAAGQRYVAVVFTNVGGRPCTLSGYPGVAGLDAAGQQLTQARRVPGVPLATVTLAPRATASAIVQATAVPTGPATTCPPDYPALLVTPPGFTTSVRVPVVLPSCGGLDVRGVVAGPSGV